MGMSTSLIHARCFASTTTGPARGEGRVARFHSARATIAPESVTRPLNLPFLQRETIDALVPGDAAKPQDNSSNLASDEPSDGTWFRSVSSSTKVPPPPLHAASPAPPPPLHAASPVASPPVAAAPLQVHTVAPSAALRALAEMRSARKFGDWEEACRVLCRSAPLFGLTATRDGDTLETMRVAGDDAAAGLLRLHGCAVAMAAVADDFAYDTGMSRRRSNAFLPYSADAAVVDALPVDQLSALTDDQKRHRNARIKGVLTHMVRRSVTEMASSNGSDAASIDEVVAERPTHLELMGGPVTGASAQAQRQLLRRLVTLAVGESPPLADDVRRIEPLQSVLSSLRAAAMPDDIVSLGRLPKLAPGTTTPLTADGGPQAAASSHLPGERTLPWTAQMHRDWCHSVTASLDSLNAWEAALTYLGDRLLGEEQQVAATPTPSGGPPPAPSPRCHDSTYVLLYELLLRVDRKDDARIVLPQWTPRHIRRQIADAYAQLIEKTTVGPRRPS